jgi:hypothetical protein
MPNTPTPDSCEGDDEQIKDEFTVEYISEAERAKAIQDAVDRHPARKFELDGGDIGDEKIDINFHEPKCPRMYNPTEVDTESWARIRMAAIGYTCLTDRNGFNLE